MGKLFISPIAEPRGGPVMSSPDDFGAAQAQGIGAVGQAISATAQIAGAIEKSRARTAANAYGNDMLLAEQNITADINDVQNWERRLDAASTELRKIHGSKGFIHQGVYNEAADRRRAERDITLRSSLNSILVKKGLESYKQNIVDLGDEYANTLDPKRREDILQGVDLEVGSAIENNLIFAESVEDERRTGKSRAVEGAVARYVDENPDEAERILRQHGSLLDPKVEAALTREARNARHRLNNDAAAEETAADARSKRAFTEKQTRNATYALGRARGGQKDSDGVPIVLRREDLDQMLANDPEALSPLMIEKTEKIVRAGGLIIAKTPDPKVLATLYDALYKAEALNDITFETRLLNAAMDGDISDTVYKALRKENRDQRLKIPMAMIQDTIDILKKNQPAAAIAAADARADILVWYSAHPDATDAAIRDEGIKILETYDLRSALARGPIRYPDAFVFNTSGGRVNLEATRAVLEELSSGPNANDQELADAWIMLIDEERRQEDEAKRRATRGQQP